MDDTNKRAPAWGKARASGWVQVADALPVVLRVQGPGSANDWLHLGDLDMNCGAAQLVARTANGLNFERLVVVAVVVVTRRLATINAPAVACFGKLTKSNGASHLSSSSICTTLVAPHGGTCETTLCEVVATADIASAGLALALSHLGALLSSKALSLLDPCPVPAILHLKHMHPSRRNAAVIAPPVADGRLPDAQFLSELAYTAFDLDRYFEDLHAHIVITSVGKYKPDRVTFVTS